MSLHNKIHPGKLLSARFFCCLTLYYHLFLSVSRKYSLNQHIYRQKNCCYLLISVLLSIVHFETHTHVSPLNSGDHVAPGSPSEAAEAALAGPGRLLIDGVTLGRGQWALSRSDRAQPAHGTSGVTRRNAEENSKGYESLTWRAESVTTLTWPPLTCELSDARPSQQRTTLSGNWQAQLGVVSLHPDKF